MSNASGASGWWLASDGRWYPPEQSPWRRGFVQPTGPTGFSAAGTAWPATVLGPPRTAGRVRLQKLDARIKSLLAITLVLIIAAVAIPILGGSPSTLVTQSVERQVIATTWQKFSRAFSTENLAGLRATTTTGALATIAGSISCGCAPWRGSTISVWYSAPPQFRYPIYFYAEIESEPGGGAASIDKEVVFREAGPTRPWLVAYLGEAGDVSVFALPGNLSPLLRYFQSSPPHVPVAMTTIPQQFSALFQTVDQTGKVPPLPPRFEDTPLLAQDIASSQLSYQDEQAAHLSDRVSHRVLQVSPVFAMPSGDVVCVELGVGNYITPGPGSTIVQPTDRSRWGTLLAPGSYSSLGEVSVFDSCFFEELGKGSIIQVTNMGGLVDIAPNVGPSSPSRSALL
jgi:hypothetical protein